MPILGIDWGKSKVGLAYAESVLAEPLKVIRYTDEDKLLQEIKNIIVSHNIGKVIVGESENVSATAAHKLGEKIKKDLNTPVEYHDETLTSFQAKFLSREAGIKRKKRKHMEDAYAATILLQSYLDSTTI